MTIGEVLARLRPEFPDITISKIRYLESEGLIDPARTSSGYRKFTYADAERLRYVLRAQRDQYLPLRVIRENLEAVDDAASKGQPGPSGAPRPVAEASTADTIASFDRALLGRLTRAELLEASGLTNEQLQELEQYGLIIPRQGRSAYDTHNLEVAKLAVELQSYGLEPRHLRAAKTAAARQAGLIEQLVGPLHRGPESRAHVTETAQHIVDVSVRLHANLLQAELSVTLGR